MNPSQPLFDRLRQARPATRYSIYFLLGALLTLSYAPFGLAWLQPAMVLPILVSALAAAPAAAARDAFWFGVGHFLSGTYWIYVSVHVFGQAPLWIAILLMFALVLIMAAYFAGIGWSVARLAAGRPWRLALAAPAAWVLIEWLRGWFLSGFPWLSLGYAHIDTPLAGWAPVLGVYGVSWMLLVSACGLLLLLLRQRPLSALLLAALPWVTGQVLREADWTAPAGAPQTVTIVQGGVSQDRKWLPEQFGPTLALYRDALLAAERSDLVVWPEVAIPAVVDQVERYLDVMQDVLQSRGQSLALGILERERETGRVYNSVLLLDGSRIQIYRKRHLVPFGEYFPVPGFVREWMRLMSLPNSDLTAGREEQPLLVARDGTALAAAICYEDAYGAEQRYALPGAHLLVNVSNDAWFGDSIAPHQHLQIARMRALEAGRWVVRATNNGISAFIGPTGRLEQLAPQFRFATLSAAIEPRSGETPWVRTGNWPLLALLGGSAALAAWRSRRR